MKVIARNRKSGKTTDLIKESYSTGAYILVHHPSQADMIKRQAEKMGMDSLPYPITLNDLSRNVSMYNKTKGILIDNAELVLQSLIPVPINTITVSTTERRRRKKLISESEETKEKNIEWLKSWFSNKEMYFTGEYITSKIDQLDEQERRTSKFYRKFVDIVQSSPVSANVLLDTLANLVAKQDVLGVEEQEITEEPTKYRFTQNAFMEQDFTANNYEEAEKMAEAEWKRMFEKEGLFGEPEFEGRVEE